MRQGARACRWPGLKSVSKVVGVRRSTTSTWATSDLLVTGTTHGTFMCQGLGTEPLMTCQRHLVPTGASSRGALAPCVPSTTVTRSVLPVR